MAAAEGVANVDAAVAAVAAVAAAGVDVIDLCDDDGAEKGAKIVSNSRGGLTIEIADDDDESRIPQRSNTRKQRKSAPKTCAAATKRLPLESTGKGQAPEAARSEIAQDNDTAIVSPRSRSSSTRKRKSTPKKTATLPLESAQGLQAEDSNEVTPTKKRRRTAAPPKFWYTAEAPFTWTDDTVYFEIDGKPVSKRASACTTKKFYHFFDSTGRLGKQFAAVVTQLFHEKRIVGTDDELVLPKFAKGTALKATLQFFFPLANDPTANTREQNIFTVGDCDNFSKFVLDALRKIVYSDDCYVVELHVTKSFDPTTTKGRTTVSISKCA